MTHLYAILNSASLGGKLELQQSGTVLTVNDVCDINRTALALFPKSTGVWDSEFLVWGSGDLLASVGITLLDASLATYVGGDAGYGYRLDLGEIHNAGASVASVGVAAKGDVIRVRLDLTSTQPTLTWYRNGTLVYTQALPSAGPWVLAASLGGSEAYGLSCFLNTGQRAFETAPAGALGWYEPSTTLHGVRLASEDWMSDPADVVSNQRYSDLLAGDNAELRAVRSLDFWPWQRGVQSGAMVLTALDDGSFDDLLNADARDLPVLVSTIHTGDTYAQRVNLFSAVIDDVSTSDDLTVKLTCKDPLGLLDVPLQRWLIRPDADTNSANTPRPILLGACRNVPTVLIDASTYSYAISDAPILGVGFARDSGYPLDPAAVPPDFTLGADKLGMTLAREPVGKVTIDASSVGGQQLPQPSDDILAGAGNPPAGLATGGDTPPVIAGGVLTFPQIANSSTIRISGDIQTDGYNGIAGNRACVRVSWRDENGVEMDNGGVGGHTDGPPVTGTTALATYTAEMTAPAGSSFGVMEFVAYGHTAGTATFSNAKAWYVLPSGEVVAIPLVDPTFVGSTGWDTEVSAQGNLWEFQPGKIVKHPDTSGAQDNTTSKACRNHYLAPDIPQTTSLGWAKLTSVTKYGSGKSYRVKIVIGQLPEGYAAIILATGTTIDTALQKWTQAGTYTVTLTNSDGVDHDLYLLGYPLVPGAVPVPPDVSSIVVETYDDTYTPNPIDTTPALLLPILLADYLHQVFDVRGDQVGVSWSTSDAEAIDSVSGYAGIGVYLDGGETVAAAVDMALASYTACKWCDGNGVIRFTRMIAPEAVAIGDRAGTIDINAMGGDLVPALDAAPGLTTQMGVRRNWAQLSDGDLVSASGNFPLAVRQSMLRTYQQTASTAKPLAGAYRHALYAPAVASCFDQVKDGQAEIDRVAGIYGVQRRFYAVPVELDALQGMDLGQIWTLVYPKYGLSAGKAVTVINFEPDLLANTANIVLWG